MRALTILLICFAMAFQGLANAHVFEEPCAMAEDMHGAMTADAGAVDECCLHGDATAETGTLCTSGQDCNLAQVFAVVSLQSQGQGPVAPRFTPLANPFPPSSNPSDIWRPPAFS